MFHNTFPQECPAKWPTRIVRQECPTRVSNIICAILIDLVYLLSSTCLHSGSWVPSCFAFNTCETHSRLLGRNGELALGHGLPGARRSQRCDSTNSCTSERPMRSRIPREESWSCLSKLVINVCLVCAGCFRMLLVLCRSVLLMVEGNMMEPLR